MKKLICFVFMNILFSALVIFFPSCQHPSRGNTDYPLTLSSDTMALDTLRWHATMDDGKGFTILEDKSMGYSISNILIFPEGFGNNDTILTEA